MARKGAGRRKPTRPPEEPPRAPWRKRLGWAMLVVGAVLFLGGQIGARTGLVFLPFDPHHFLAQLVGGLVALNGLIWATQE